jgi:hypothetical protein
MAETQVEMFRSRADLPVVRYEAVIDSIKTKANKEGGSEATITLKVESYHPARDFADLMMLQMQHVSVMIEGSLVGVKDLES